MIYKASIILLTYNQSQYALVSLDSVLNQIGGPFDIIVSDDCSKDDTYALLAERVANYDGVHRVRLRRTEANRGILNHVIEAARLAEAPLVIFAAGDDVSTPNRAQLLAEAFEVDPRIGCVTSQYRIMDSEGGLHETYSSYRSGNSISFFTTAEEAQLVVGSMAGWDRNLFDLIEPNQHKGMYEDDVLTFLVYTLGLLRVELDEPLVNYRKHDGSLTNNTISMSPTDWEIKRDINLRAVRSKLQLYVEISNSHDPDEVTTDRSALQSELNWLDAQLDWPEKSFPNKLSTMVRIKTDRKPKKLTWMALRLFGRAPIYQPLLFLKAIRSLAQRRDRPAQL